MDTQKDNFAQEEKAESTAISNIQEPISFFDKDEDFTFVFKKTEKLTTAVYMVTNLFSDNEPMKWTLRKKVSDLLSFTVGYKDVLGSQNSDFVNEVKTRVLEVVSLLEVSSFAGLISQMNFSIIKQEFLKLVNNLDSSEVKSKGSTQHVLPQSFFDEVPSSSSTKFGNALFPQKIQYSLPHTITKTSNGFIKDKESAGDASVFKRTNRQNIILGLLKKKKDLTIKDIGHVIKDCSEKTIQRELIALIMAGVLKKTGERRWSKYSLV